MENNNDEINEWITFIEHLPDAGNWAKCFINVILFLKKSIIINLISQIIKLKLRQVK